ncbi:non-hydrolyzing UDP-N-acetylglucosamine 2-epimerase [Pseudobacteriovorax antillogorgiicola]|uniref:UDP-GlcNAc3NAcA epimerase n=1 Tax=Pseudobacteriovorax antillogorgiicola TaxID=1513793 RepID=A0A1Y6CMT4_9BACT|nr:UDP-N-acetylglucosamine 2-epimerase (non-hydrolyzing) [Pseudobacteriovorax antillogorgiicola]TCS45230.1 UDP-GlcNAc3NAcA epimerase [Pseudobacteriovorax antillogorgiicola]SMF75348.1 UDP-GlcNAc3NAcA epimerase [Pseudobacteriovorax antillogorgiicola]
MKICTVVGARPQFIKAAALSQQIKNFNGINEVIVHTGQHYDPQMSDVFFEQMSIPRPVYNLAINGGSHGSMTGKMIQHIEHILLIENPDCVVVFGDTNSTLSAAIAASKIGIPIAHIEAGLRSFNMSMPEEINRILTDRVSKFLFCPTKTAVYNLANEGIPSVNLSKNIPCIVENTGDIMYDAVKMFGNSESFDKTILNRLRSDKKNIFVTLHRQENVDSPDKLTSMINAIGSIAQEANVIFPIHPRTKNSLKKFKLNLHPNIQVSNPLGYIELLQIVKRCDLVMTDSGGLQKEAYFLKKPAIILREQTEWLELIEQNSAFLCGSDLDMILSKYRKAINSDVVHRSNLFGAGDTSQRIISFLH